MNFFRMIHRSQLSPSSQLFKYAEKKSGSQFLDVVTYDVRGTRVGVGLRLSRGRTFFLCK